MIIRINLENKYEYFYLALWGCYTTLFYFLSVSELPYMYDTAGVMRMVNIIFSCILIVLFFLFNKFTAKSVLKYFSFLLLAFLILLINQSISLLVQILFIICFPAMDIITFRKFIKFDMIMKTIFAILIISLCLMGLVNNFILVTAYAIKYSLGFNHPNLLGMFVYIILLEWLFVRFGRMRMKDWILILAIGFLVYLVATPRTSAFAFLFIYLVFIVANKKSKWLSHGWIRFGLVALTPLLGVVTMISSLLYKRNSETWIFLDKILSGRLSVSSALIDKYGLSAFGQKMDILGMREAKILHTAAHPLDCAYVRCAMMYGLIAFIVLCMAYMVLMNYSMRRKLFHIALMCLFFILIGVGESYMLYPVYNVTLFCLLQIESLVSIKDKPATIEFETEKQRGRVPQMQNRMENY